MGLEIMWFLVVVWPERNLETTIHQMEKSLCIYDGILRAREGNKSVLSRRFMEKNKNKKKEKDNGNS